MKHLKAKLMASVGMLLVAIIMMSTASYAWFTISTNPEIANVTANITANGNLEIALGETTPKASAVGDSGTNAAWGNLIDLQQAFKRENNNVVTLKPVQMVVTGTDKTAEFDYPKYNLDGRISTLADLVKVGAVASDSDNASVAFNDVTGVNWYVSEHDGSKVTNTNIYAFSVDFWLRTNASGTDQKSQVKLTTPTDRANGATNSQDGLGSYIKGDSKGLVTIAFRASETDGVQWYLASRTDAEGNIVLRKATYSDTDKVLKFDGTGEASITLKQNEATKVTMYVYVDGAARTNADAYLDMASIQINVQFEIAGLQDAMNVNMNQENGRNE